MPARAPAANRAVLPPSHRIPTSVTLPLAEPINANQLGGEFASATPGQGAASTPARRPRARSRDEAGLEAAEERATPPPAVSLAFAAHIGLIERMHAPFRRPFSARLPLLLVAVFAACGGDDDGSRRLDGDVADVVDSVLTEEVTFPDTRPPETDAGDSVEDSDDDEVAATCTTDPGGFGCPCADNADCNSDFCLPSRDGGKVCTQYCTSDCPLDWRCQLVNQPTPDPTFICVEVGLNLCRPCTADAQCQGGATVATGDRCARGGDDRAGAFCGIGCGAEEVCPTGYSCQSVVALEGGAATEQCVPTAGVCECSGRAVEEDAFTTCNDRACLGTRSCTEFGLTACDARPFADEICDGHDNDCDDASDEGFLDSDGDTIADCVDPDDDDDTILDVNDNCTLTPNVDQLNSDTDPFGNACDSDDDDDTLLDGADNCPIVANSDQADSDGQAPGDACDNAAPAPPTLTVTVPASPSANATPTVSGSGEIGATVTFYTDPDCSTPPIGTALASAGGSFSGDATVPTNTTSVLHGTATDGAGNVSECSPEPLVYTHDSLAPATPVLTATNPTSPSRTGLNPAVSGTGDRDDVATARLYVGTCSGTPLGTSPIVAGAFVMSGVASPNVTTPFVADAVDVVGNVSGCSAPLEYVHDSQAPSAPVLISTTPPSPSNGTLTPVINGTAEIGTTITLFTSSACTTPLPASASADATTGVFAITGTAGANATTTFYGKATDTAGNTSGCSTGLAYVHDGNRPTKPVLTMTTPTSPSPSTSPSVKGQADAGTTVRLFADACVTPLGAPTTPQLAAADRSFSFATSLAANTTTELRANATDGAGNISDCSDVLAYVSDSQAPAAPVLSGTTPSSPSNVLTPSLNGSAELGVTVRLYAAAACGGSAVASFGPTTVAAFSRPVTAAANSVTTFTATATDAAGNVSACSAPLTYTHDGDAPSAPVLTGTTPASPSGTVTNPTVNGTFSEPGASIDLFANGACSGTPTTTLAAAGTTFAIAVTVSANSTTTFTALARDAIGNTSGCSNAVTYIHDTSGPAKPTLDSSTPASPSDVLTPTLAGSAEAGSTIKIYTTPTCTGTPVSGTADGTGHFVGIAVTASADLVTNFYASATDALGNASPCSDAFPYTHDSGGPPKPAITSSNPASGSTDQSPNLSGTTGEPGVTTYIYRNAVCTGSPVASGPATGVTGAFTINAPANPATVTSFYANAVDAVGNTSLCSNKFDYTHVQPVNAPRIIGFEPPSADFTTTNIKALGKAVNDPDVVNLYYGDSCGGAPINASPAGVTGTDWSINFTATALGCTTVSAKAIGSGGNLSPCSEPAVFAHYGCAQCICQSSNDWIRQTGTFFADRGRAAAFHSTGSVYLAGTTEGAILGQTALGGSDAFLSEYGSNGNETPGNAKIQIGTSARDTATSVIVDDATPHFVYVAGSTEGDIDGSGVPSNADAWIAKYNSFSNVRVWIKRYASPRRDSAVDLAFDGTRILMLIESSDAATGLVRSPRVVAVDLANGNFTDRWNADNDTLDQSADGLAIEGANIYVHGRVASPIVGALSQSGTGGGGLYIYKLTNATPAVVTWVQHWGSAGDDTASDLLLSGGWVYAAAAVSGALEGLNSAGTYAARKDIGVVNLNASTGAQVWARVFGTQADDMPTAIGFNTTVQVLGYTSGTITNSASSTSINGGIDFFLAPLMAATGAPGTPRQFGTSGNDLPGRGALIGGRWYIPGGSDADWTGLSRDACTYKDAGDAFITNFCASLPVP